MPIGLYIIVLSCPVYTGFHFLPGPSCLGSLISAVLAYITVGVGQIGVGSKNVLSLFLP